MEALMRDNDARTKTWEKLISDYEQKAGILSKELEDTKNEFNELETKKANLAEKYGDTNVDEDDLIQINVGGRAITASRGTLTHHKGTMLEALFSGRWDKRIQRDGFGHIFLDVNPVCFQRMINYLSMQKKSSEERMSQFFHTDRELQLILHHTMTYFGIEPPFSFPEPSTTNVTRNVFGWSSAAYAQVTQLPQNMFSNKAIWETMTFDEFPSNLKKNMSQEQKSLRSAKEDIEKVKKNLEKEEDFIRHVNAQSLHDIINFDVRGTLMTAKRSTLRVFKGSQLDRLFDDAVWLQQHTNTLSIKEWSHEQVADWAKRHDGISDEVADLFDKNQVNGLELLALGREDLKEMGISRLGMLALVIKAIKDLQTKNQNRPIFIDHDPYCFGKILDQLRLKVMSKEGYKPLAWSDIKESKQEAFEKSVDYYFPGELSELIVKKKPMVDSRNISSAAPNKDYQSILIKFYEKYNPSKLGSVQNTLKKYQGKEEDMFAQLATQYGAPNPLDGTAEPKQGLGFQNSSHFSTLLASTNAAPLLSSSFGTLSLGGQTLTPTSSNLGNSDPFLSSSAPITFPPLSGQLPTAKKAARQRVSVFQTTI